MVYLLIKIIEYKINISIRNRFVKIFKYLFINIYLNINLWGVVTQ